MDIIQSRVYGKTLVARRYFRAGEIILTEQPTVAVAGVDSGAYYRLTDKVLETPGLAEVLCDEFGARITRIELEPEQMSARRDYLARAVRAHPTLSVPAVIDVVAALHLRTWHPEGVTGIYPTLNYINHSCNNNAALKPHAQPSVQQLVALRDIKPGEEITMSYIGFRTYDEQGNEQELNMAALLPPSERQSMTKQQYGFVCACPSCRPRPATHW